MASKPQIAGWRRQEEASRGVELAVRKIVEEALEAEVAEALGRG